jgi:hypothetical protein
MFLRLIGYSSLWATLLILNFGSCKTIKAPEPEYIENAERYVPKTSEIELPVSITYKELSAYINKSMGTVVYEDRSYTSPEEDDIQLVVRRNTSVKTAQSGSDVLITLPLSIWSKARWSPCSFCPKPEKEFTFDVDVFVKARPTIDKSYVFKANLSSDGFQWKKKPVLELGPFDIPISGMIEKPLDKQIKESVAATEKEINNAFNLKSEITRLWNTATEPLLLDSVSSTWLVIRPQKLFLQPITMGSQSITFTIGAEAHVNTYTGAKPSRGVLAPLPELVLRTERSNKFLVEVVSEIGFEDATLMAEKSLKGQEFSLGKKKIKIEGITVFGKGRRAYVQVVFSGRVKGAFYLSGVPAFDPEKEELYFENLDYDIQSKNLLLKSSQWLLDETLRATLQKKLRFEAKETLSSIRKNLDVQLNNTVYFDQIVLNGKLNTFEVQGIYLTEKAFRAVLSINGTAAIGLKNIKF